MFEAFVGEEVHLGFSRRPFYPLAFNRAVHQAVGKKRVKLAEHFINLPPGASHTVLGFCLGQIVSAYRLHLDPGLGPGRLSGVSMARAPVGFTPAIEGLMNAISLDLRRASPLVAANEIAAFYEALVPQERRKDEGIFYTPPGLAYTLIDHTDAEEINWETSRILEPACGSGILFLRLLARKKEALASRKPARQLKILAEDVVGVDKDPLAASLCQSLAEILLHDLTRAAGEPCPTLVRTGDFLAENGQDGPFDVIVTNPPYGKAPLGPSVQARFQPVIGRGANLYAQFLMRAIELSSPTGVISMIIPTSLMGGASFRTLRRFILAETRPSRFDRVAARKNVFEDALQETMMITLRKDKKPGLGRVYRTEIKGDPKAWRGPGLKRSPRHPIRPLPHGDNDLKMPIGRFRLPQDPEAPWFLPREAKDDRLLKRLTIMPARLKDWGVTVSTGPILWDRAKGRLRDQPSARTFPLIFAQALQGPLLSEYRGIATRPCDLEFSDQDPRDHLVTSPCVLLKRTSANEQSRRLFASELTEAFLIQCGGAVAIENHVNILRPSDPAAFPLCLSTLTGLFNSPILDCIFRLQSGSASVSAFELNHLPLPKLSDIQRLDQEMRRGGGLERFNAALEALYQGP